jgi:hypothetical protein
LAVTYHFPFFFSLFQNITLNILYIKTVLLQTFSLQHIYIFLYFFFIIVL